MLYIYRSLFFIWMLIIIEAIPWPMIFGEMGDVDEHEGRIPEMDEFLRSHAAMLAEPSEHYELVQQALSLAREYKVDPESAKYYVDLLMKIEKNGLNILNRETEDINKKMAKVLVQSAPQDQMTHVLKQRHILDAFFDAAADVAWPWIRSHADPMEKEEL